MRRSFVLVSSCALCCSWTAAHAQANANAVAKAADGFGFTSGSETVGLYDQSSVRGFDLEAGGNYRLNGTYFVKNAGTSSFFLENTTVRIGYNTLDLPFPGPLGVVDFTLRDPARGEKSVLTAGLDYYAQPYVEGNLRHRNASGNFSYSVGATRVFDIRDEQGGHGGDSWLFAGTARFTTGLTTIQAFAGDYEYEEAGQYRVAPGTAGLPPRISRQTFSGPDWARDKAARRIGGLLVDAGAQQPFGIGLTSVVSQEDPRRRSREIFSNVAADGSADAIEIVLPHQPSIAWSNELRAHLQTHRGAFLNRIDISGRMRLQRSRFGGGTAVPLGRQQLGDELAGDPPPPALVPEARSVSHVRQYGFGVSDRGRLGQWLRWNAGLLKTDYRDRISIPAFAAQTSRASPWLYNAGIAVQPVHGIEVYGSYSRGLEEAGVAPVTAANANQVLDPIMVTQKEVGVRLSVLPRVSILTGWFDTRKPYAAIDAHSGAYGFVGEVEHKGVEFSLAGKAIPQVTMVVGGVWIQPRVVRKDVAADLRPVAVPRLRISASAEANIAAVPGLSVDGGVVATGRRAAQSLPVPGSGQLMVPATTLINAGVRYSTRLGGRDVVLRAQVQNLFNQFAWNVDSSETLAPIAGRHARVILSTLF